MLHYGFDIIGLKRIIAVVKPENIPSKAVIEKLGFECVDTKVIPYDSQMCEFDYYKLYNSNVWYRV